MQLELFPEARVRIDGDPDLVDVLHGVVSEGFPGRSLPHAVEVVAVRWNHRLRATVGRAIRDPRTPTIEISVVYNAAHPDELLETLAHEYAHLLQPAEGHGPRWRRELEAGLARLGIPVRPGLVHARHGSPEAGRYRWLCSGCGAVVGSSGRRRRDEVAIRSRCCGVSIGVLDGTEGVPAPPRPHRVACRACGTAYAAYDDVSQAARFARRHRCRCGGRLRVFDGEASVVDART